MEAIGTAFLSAIFEQLIEKLSSRASLSFISETQVVDRLKKWERMLKVVYAVLDDAEEKQIANDFVKNWVTELKHLAYDVEDILDEFSTEAQRRKLAEDRERTTRGSNKVLKLLPSCCSSGMMGMVTGKFGFNSEMVAKMGELSSRLQQLMEERNVLGLREIVAGKKKKGSLVSGRERPPTTSLVNEATVRGRESDKEAIMEMLKRDDDDDFAAGCCSTTTTTTTTRNYSVIPIVGMGGLGKTTLAQLVYNDASVGFRFKAWVSVGEDFDVVGITRAILGGSEGDLNSLQLKLKERVLGQKFLIVLDDIWMDRYTDWTLLCGPLEYGARGSRIIVTTRLKDVAKMVGTTGKGYELKRLEYDDCLSVFLHHALDASSFDSHPNLEEAGRAIVKKCQGLPLPAKAIGGLLRGETSANVWREVMRSALWESSVGKTDILPALRLSYYHLPSHLKVCFAYCAIFPKDYEFEEEELVLLWMAEGFLEQPKKNKHPKQLGHENFRDLLSRSFFQQSGGVASKYVMHDMMNDLAQFVSSGICFNLDNIKSQESSAEFSSLFQENRESFPAKVRHSAFASYYYDVWQRFKIFEKTKYLRTFLPVASSIYSDSYLSMKVVHDIVPKLKCLRVLSFAHYDMVEFPDSIDGLKHLRYLNFSYTRITTVSESTGKLINLQTLLLKGCRFLTSLPSSLGDLINLQCLDVRGTPFLKEIPAEIANLPRLKLLPKYILGTGNGFGIVNLAKFSPLQGVFQMEGLHNVSDARDAKLVRLKEKEGIRKLVLEWSGECDSSRNDHIDLQVLRSLEPDVDVRKVEIKSYKGDEFPFWLGDSSFSNLVTLEFFRCSRMTSLPQLGQLPSLKKLKIIDCPKLVGRLITCLPNVTELRVEGCQAKALQRSTNAVGDALSSITTCKLERISGLVDLGGTFIPDLVTLETLEIRYCHQLKCLWGVGDHSSNPEDLNCLRRLKVEYCDSLVSLTGLASLPRNVKTLKITACHQLKELPNGLHNLTSLNSLTVYTCPNLVSFPDGWELPQTLQKLVVKGCNSLQSLPVVSHGRHTRLTTLMLDMPDSLKQSWVPNGTFPDSLKHLDVSKWTSLLLQRLQQSSLSNLTWLGMGDSPVIECSPALYQWGSLLSTAISLTELRIWGCPKLRSLPDELMHTLKSLHTLHISSCEILEHLTESEQGGFPTNLCILSIHNCRNLRQPISEWRLHALTSLLSLVVRGPNPATEMVNTLPDDHDGSSSSTSSSNGRGCILLLPTSLRNLTVEGFKNLRSITSRIQTLTSLQSLQIWDCPLLKYLPKEGFPTTLGRLSIRGSPLMKEGCLKAKGVYWPIIKDIPCLEG